MTDKLIRGYLVITAINPQTGLGDSETLEIHAQRELEGGGDALLLRDATGGNEWTEMTTRNIIPAPVYPEDFGTTVTPDESAQAVAEWERRATEPYRKLIRHMIKNDGPCQGPTCGLSTMGHLLDGLRPELIDLVRAEDERS